MFTFKNLPTTDFDGRYKLFPKKYLKLNPDILNCFIGCNGSGKTTLIEYLISYLKKHYNAEDIGDRNPFRHIFSDEPAPETNTFYISFDKKSKEGVSEDYIVRDLFINSQSTGESIIYRFGGTLAMMGDFLRNKNNSGSTLFVFFDDCDAGTSIDKIIDILDIFELIKTDAAKNNITCYFVLTANSYEIARNSNCIDVSTYETYHFTDYESYKSFVLNSRKLHSRKLKEENYGK